MKSANAEGLEQQVLRAAIYARKSTDENDKHKDNKSVQRQVDEARALIQNRYDLYMKDRANLKPRSEPLPPDRE